MNPKINDGGPAFPRPVYVELDYNDNKPEKGNITCNGGMSLRQWYAGKIMQGICASDKSWEQAHAVSTTEGITPYAVLALWAVDAADALIAREAATRQASQ